MLHLLLRDPVHTDLRGSQSTQRTRVFPLMDPPCLQSHGGHSTETRCPECQVFLLEVFTTPKGAQARHTGQAPAGSGFTGAPSSRDTAEPFCPEVWLEIAHVLNNTFPQMRTSIRWHRQPAPQPGSGQDDTSVPAQGAGSFPSPQGPFVRTAQPALTRSSLCPTA